MLQFRPDTVDMTRARDFRASAENSDLPATGAAAFAWAASDLNPAGVVGEAHLASAENGRLTAERRVADMVTLAAARLDDLHPIRPEV